jgi:flagellar biosynthesis protein FlhG
VKRNKKKQNQPNRIKTMKNRIPDQAEKLRQLAAKENGEVVKSETATATLEPHAPATALPTEPEVLSALLSDPGSVLETNADAAKTEKNEAPVSTPTKPQQESVSPAPVSSQVANEAETKGTHETSAVRDTPEPPLAKTATTAQASASPGPEPVDLRKENDAGKVRQRDVMSSVPAVTTDDITPTEESSDTTQPTAAAIPATKPEEAIQGETKAADRASTATPAAAVEITPASSEAETKGKTIASTEATKAETPGKAGATLEIEKPPEPARSSLPSTQADQVIELLSKKRFPLDGKTQVIAITGGKGGVGKSNVACNLAISMSQMNKSVMLLDADLSLANIDVLMGITPRLNLYHVIKGEKTIQEIIVKGPEDILIIPGGSGLEELSNISLDGMERVFDAFANLEPAPDILIVDTAAGIHPNVIQFLLAADQIIVVTTPEPTAYTDAYALIKTIVKYDKEKEIGVLVNMVNRNQDAIEVIKLMMQICRQMLHITFNNIGYIPRDPAVLKSVRHQTPLLLIAPNSPAAQSIRRIASTILQIETKSRQPRGLGHFIRRLFGHKRVS